MTDNIQAKRDEKLCFQWYTNNKHRTNFNPSLECPCDSGLLRFDPRFDVNRFDSERRLLCYASLLLKNNIVRIFSLQIVHARVLMKTISDIIFQRTLCKLKCVISSIFYCFQGMLLPNVCRYRTCLLYTSPSPRDLSTSRMPSSA